MLYLFAFSMVFENWNIFAIKGITIPKLIGYFFVGISLLNIKSLVNWAPVKQYITPMLLFLFSLFFSFILNYDNDFASLWVIKSWILKGISVNILFFFFLISIIVNKPDVGFKMFISLNIGIFILTILFLFNVGVEYHDNRLSIFGENPNLIGIFCVFSIVFILSSIFENKQQLSMRRYGLALFLFPLLKIVAETGSRVTFLGLMLSLFVFFMFQKRGKLLSKIIISISGIVFIIAAINYFMNTGVLSERLLKTYESNDLGGRDYIWVYLLPYIIEKPVFGLGVNGYIELCTLVFGRYFSPHNVFIEILIYCGAVGLFTFLFFYYRMIKTAWSVLQKQFYILPCVLLIFIFFIFFSGQGLMTKPFWIVYAYVVSVPLEYDKAKI
jgi:O-antigen ligase